MSGMRTLGVAVVGLGVGEQHARTFAAHSSCQVRCLYDLDMERAQRLSQLFPGSVVASAYGELLNRPDIDIISIASFDDAHYEQVVQALKAGKHLFVEKPLCRTMDELAHIRDLWAASGGKLKLRSNLVLRSAELYRWLRGLIDSGELGDVYAFDGDYLYGRLHKVTEGWRGSVQDYSVMQGGGIHLIDLLLWLTGQRPESVFTLGNRISTARTAFKYNDFAAATLEFSSGLVGRITANYGCVHRHHHVMRVFGTQATFLYDDAGPRLHQSRDPQRLAAPINAHPLPPGKGSLIPDFVAAILADTDDRKETQSFFDGICVSIAADRAMFSGKREQVEYL